MTDNEEVRTLDDRWVAERSQPDPIVRKWIEEIAEYEEMFGFGSLELDEREERMKKLWNYYPRSVKLPKTGEIRELSRFGSQTVDALGKVEFVDKKKRVAIMRIVAGGEK